MMPTKRVTGTARRIVNSIALPVAMICALIGCGSAARDAPAARVRSRAYWKNGMITPQCPQR